MKVIFLPEDFKFFLHPDSKLILKFVKFDLKFSSLLFMLSSEVTSQLVSMLLHKAINSDFFANLELT